MFIEEFHTKRDTLHGKKDASIVAVHSYVFNEKKKKKNICKENKW